MFPKTRYPVSPRAPLPPSYFSSAVLDLASRKGRVCCSFLDCVLATASTQVAVEDWTEASSLYSSISTSLVLQPQESHCSRITQTALLPEHGLHHAHASPAWCSSKGNKLPDSMWCVEPSLPLWLQQASVFLLHLTICFNFYLNNFSLHYIFFIS